jgi:hypothetical protein
LGRLLLADREKEARERAEAIFKKQEQRREKAKEEADAEADAISEKTARLRSLRLAKATDRAAN